MSQGSEPLSQGRTATLSRIGACWQVTCQLDTGAFEQAWFLGPNGKKRALSFLGGRPYYLAWVDPYGYIENANDNGKVASKPPNTYNSRPTVWNPDEDYKGD